MVTGGETGRRPADRAVLVAAAREHSAAVTRHLERVAGRLREHGRRSARADGHEVPLPALGTAFADLSRLLLAGTSDDAVLSGALTLTVSGVEGCDGATVCLVRDGRVETAAATDDDVARTDRLQQLTRDGPGYRAATTGGTIRAERLDDGRGGVWGAVLSAPLRTPSATIGALTVYGRTPAAFGEATRTVVELVAEHAAQALTAARTLRAQQALATSLQRSLLPPRLPQLPGLALAARYDPASAGINVGGDWYDLLELGEGRVVLVIGDVAGHGLAAAMTMAQLRTAVRAYAVEGHDPARIVRLLDAFLQRIEPEGYATCVVVALDGATGAVHWANAGHPDPLVVLPDRSWRPLAGAAHVPALGVPADADPGATPGVDVLPRGARLLLFTDGLVERRREALDAGVERLAHAAVTVAGEVDLQAWCDEVVDTQIGDAEVGDDLAVLAVELAARPARLADVDRLPRVAG